MARPASKKKDVLDAALALFMRKGIRATTTRDIATRAGISEGTIYRHFASKDALAQSVFELNLDALWRFLRRRLLGTSGAEALLRAFVLGVFAYARRYQRKYSFVIAAHHTELRKMSRHRMKPFRMLERIIRIGQREGRFRNMDASLAAAMVMGTVTQTIFYLKSGRIAVNYAHVIEETARGCLQILATEPTENPPPMAAREPGVAAREPSPKTATEEVST